MFQLRSHLHVSLLYILWFRSPRTHPLAAVAMDAHARHKPSPSKRGQSPYLGDEHAHASKRRCRRPALPAADSAASLGYGEASTVDDPELTPASAAAPGASANSLDESRNAHKDRTDEHTDDWGVSSTASACVTTGAATASSDAVLAVSAAGICRQDMSGLAVMIQAQLLSNLPQASTGGGGGSGGGRPSYPHGNYHRYYGYRMTNAFDEDPRLKVLRSEWFERRACLDIGCNEGLVTIALAARFRSSSMVGLDIDKELVHKASRNLGRERAALKQQAGAKGVGRAAVRAAQQQLGALHSVSFQHADFGAMAEPPGAMYDTLLCLSVTKWVHLNAGDEGLRRFFARMASALRPGGVLVLEPQPWRSYQQAKRKQEVFSAGHRSLTELQLRPDHFVQHLQQEHGLHLVASLQCQQAAQGFGRPIFVLRKAGQETGGQAAGGP